MVLISVLIFFSAIKGFQHRSLRPVTSGSVSELKQVPTESHLIFTAETHNFPTGVAPFSGATTGTGGRIRDVQSVGRGGYCIAGTAGYSVGNLQIPGMYYSYCYLFQINFYLETFMYQKGEYSGKHSYQSFALEFEIILLRD